MPGGPGEHGPIAPESVPVEHRPKDTVPPPEDKIRTKPCRHFENGRCSWGDSCRFLHTTQKALKRQNAQSVDVDPKDSGSYLAPQGERPLRFHPNGSTGTAPDGAVTTTRAEGSSTTSTYDHTAAYGQRQSQTVRPAVRRSPRHGGSSMAPPRVAGASTSDVPTPNTSTVTAPQLGSPLGSSNDFLQHQQLHQLSHAAQQHHHQHYPPQHQQYPHPHPHHQQQQQHQHQQQQQQQPATQAFVRPPSYGAGLFAGTPPRTSPTATGPPGPADANPFRVNAAPSSQRNPTDAGGHAAGPTNDFYSGSRRQSDPNRARPARPTSAGHPAALPGGAPYQQPTYAPGVVPSASFSGSGGGLATDAFALHSGTSDPSRSLGHPAPGAAAGMGGSRTKQQPPGHAAHAAAGASRGSRPEGLTLSPSFGGSGSVAPGGHQPTTPGSSSTRYSHNPYSSSPLAQGAAPKPRTPPGRGDLMSVVVGLAGTAAPAADTGGVTDGGLPMLPTPMMQMKARGP